MIMEGPRAAVTAMTQHVSFGRHRFEPDTGRLWTDEREIKLTPKASAVLGRLIERAGALVSKQELFDTVWSSTVVGDDALVTCIQELRKALGDDARQPTYIETRHRLGYLFVAPLSRPAPAPAAAAKAATPTENGIAVLPFIDMSPERDQAYFCEGLAEELIDALTRVAGLRVVARSSSFPLGHAGQDPREIGWRLGVGSLITGSVRKAGDQLRITVQMLDVASGFQKWSRRFERRLGDIFAIQDEIAEFVATTLRGGALSVAEKSALQRPHTALETYEFFLRGRQSLHRMRLPDLEHSRAMFERAIALDPAYAPAWAGLAMVHCILYEWWASRDEDLADAERASRIAMELAPDLADTHVARGFTLSLQRQYAEAGPHFETAARINPQLYDAYYFHGRMCFACGEIARSAELFLRAAEVRQDDFQSMYLAGQSLRMLGRDEEAAAVNRESVLRAERVLALNPLDGRTLSLGTGALFHDGQVQRALEWSRRSLELYPDDISTLINATCLQCRLGNKEAALDLLERAFGRSWGKRNWIEHDPDYDILRDEPRFQQLLARLK